MVRKKFGSVIGIILIIAFFVFSSYLVQENLDSIKESIDYGFPSMVLYVFILIVAIVLAPVSAMPLLPLASGLWGWVLAGILSIIGWTLGAIIAFIIAREYGVPLVSKVVSLDKIQRFEKLMPEENIFWSIVFLRMVIPADVLSYALGLFSKIDLKLYTFATLIGVTPFAFIFAFAGTVNIYYQVAVLILAVVVFFAGVWIVLKRREKLKKS